jgi:hypothetical protein
MVKKVTVPAEFGVIVTPDQLEAMREQNPDDLEADDPDEMTALRVAKMRLDELELPAGMKVTHDL